MTLLTSPRPSSHIPLAPLHHTGWWGWVGAGLVYFKENGVGGSGCPFTSSIPFASDSYISGDLTSN